MQVWIVTTGEYDDYSVDEVFASEALAHAYIAMHEGSDGRQHEEMEVIERNIRVDLPPHQKVWQIRGHVHRTTDDGFRETFHVEFDLWGHGFRTIGVTPEVKIGDRQPRYVDLTVTGVDLEACREAFAEAQARIKAELDGAKAWFDAVVAEEEANGEAARSRPRCTVCGNRAEFCTCIKIPSVASTNSILSLDQ